MSTRGISYLVNEARDNTKVLTAGRADSLCGAAGYLMTPLFASVFVVAAWAPLDSIAGYFGTPKLQDIASITPRDRALHNVEHVECRATSAGCLPAGGCTSSCKPRVGHYWVAPSPSGATPSSILPLWLTAFLPPIGPSYHMMTSKGVMTIEPGFATIDYRMLVRTPTGLERAE